MRPQRRFLRAPRSGFFALRSEADAETIPGAIPQDLGGHHIPATGPQYKGRQMHGPRASSAPPLWWCLVLVLVVLGFGSTAYAQDAVPELHPAADLTGLYGR